MKILLIKNNMRHFISVQKAQNFITMSPFYYSTYLTTTKIRSFFYVMLIHFYRSAIKWKQKICHVKNWKNWWFWQKNMWKKFSSQFFWTNNAFYIVHLKRNEIKWWDGGVEVMRLWKKRCRVRFPVASIVFASYNKILKTS